MLAAFPEQAATNGFHDTANVVATGISTYALAPRVAVAGAALLNFVGAFVSLGVACAAGAGVYRVVPVAHR
jgi:inorganic phosphate transporter, PiT family